MKQTRALILFEFPSAGGAGGADPVVTQQTWASVSTALSLDSAERFARISLAKTIVFPGDTALAEKMSEIDPDLDVRVQSGESAAERCAGAFADVFDEGYRHALLLSTRLPAIPQSLLERGFALLDMFDDSIVIGPTAQGGYYAIGLRHPEPELFRGLDLCSPSLFDDTMHRVQPDRTAVYLLASWPDTSSASDAHRLLLEMRDPLPEHRFLKRTTDVFVQLSLLPQPDRDRI